MSPAVKLVAFVAVLLAVFAVSYGVGATMAPPDADPEGTHVEHQR